MILLLPVDLIVQNDVTTTLETDDICCHSLGMGNHAIVWIPRKQTLQVRICAMKIFKNIQRKKKTKINGVFSGNRMYHEFVTFCCGYFRYSHNEFDIFFRAGAWALGQPYALVLVRQIWRICMKLTQVLRLESISYKFFQLDSTNRVYISWTVLNVLHIFGLLIGCRLVSISHISF